MSSEGTGVRGQGIVAALGGISYARKHISRVERQPVGGGRVRGVENTAGFTLSPVPCPLSPALSPVPSTVPLILVWKFDILSERSVL